MTQSERAAEFPFANSGRLLRSTPLPVFSFFLGCCCALCSVGVLICPSPISSLVLRLSSPSSCLSGALCGVAVVPSSACESPTAPTAAALSLWPSQAKARSVVFLWFGIRKASFSLWLRLRWPPVASGVAPGGHHRVVASGGLRWPRQLTWLAQHIPSGGWVGPGGPWVGLLWSMWRDRSSEARLSTKFPLPLRTPDSGPQFYLV